MKRRSVNRIYRLTLKIIWYLSKVQTSQIETTDVHNGLSINRRIVIHIYCLTLRIFIFTIKETWSRNETMDLKKQPSINRRTAVYFHHLRPKHRWGGPIDRPHQLLIHPFMIHRRFLVLLALDRLQDMFQTPNFDTFRPTNVYTTYINYQKTIIYSSVSIP